MKLMLLTNCYPWSKCSIGLIDVLEIGQVQMIHFQLSAQICEVLLQFKMPRRSMTVYDSFTQVWNLGNDITEIRLGPDLCSKKPRLNACNRPKKIRLNGLRTKR